jgi:hypothetical protein
MKNDVRYKCRQTKRLIFTIDYNELVHMRGNAMNIDRAANMRIARFRSFSPSFLEISMISSSCSPKFGAFFLLSSRFR